MSEEEAFFNHALKLLHASGIKPDVSNTVWSKTIEAHFGDHGLSLMISENISIGGESLSLYFSVKIHDRKEDLFGITAETALGEALQIWRTNMAFASKNNIPIDFRARVFLTNLLAYQP